MAYMFDKTESFSVATVWSDGTDMEKEIRGFHKAMEAAVHFAAFNDVDQVAVTGGDLRIVVKWER